MAQLSSGNVHDGHTTFLKPSVPPPHPPPHAGGGQGRGQVDLPYRGLFRRSRPRVLPSRSRSRSHRARSDADDGTPAFPERGGATCSIVALRARSARGAGGARSELSSPALSRL